MANSLLTIGGITRKAIQLFRNANSFLQMVDRQYDDQFAKTGAKIGAQLRVRLPNDYTVRVGQTAVPQNTNENQVTLTIGTQAGVDVSFTSQELALSMDDFAYRVLDPMVNDLAAYVAKDVMTGAESIPNYVQNYSGSLISPVAATWLQAGAVLDINSAPRSNRNIIADPLTMARTVSTLSGLFNPQAEISKQYKVGLIAQNVLGFDWAMDQTVLLHTCGTFASGTMNGANQSGSTLTVSAITGTLLVGDLITIAGVYGVNRLTKASTGTLEQFVVTAPVSNGGTSISIYPPLNPAVTGVSQAYQTVTASPATNAAIAAVVTASSIYRKNFAFHPTAVTLATADLELPTSAVVAAGREAYGGISIRMVRDYITLSDQWLTRLDILYGYVWPRPEWAVIVGDIV